MRSMLLIAALRGAACQAATPVVRWQRGPALRADAGARTGLPAAPH